MARIPRHNVLDCTKSLHQLIGMATRLECLMPNQLKSNRGLGMRQSWPVAQAIRLRRNAVKAGRLRIGAFNADPVHEQAVARVQGWTRRRFNLPIDAAVMVNELICKRP